MDIENVGKNLKLLREQRNLTQEEVGKYLNVGRDAIVRIEKGIRKITIEELNGYSKLFNVDMDAILNNNTVENNVKGIILAGGTGSRLYPITIANSKQLLPVYDKPMIYYPLSVLMQANIKDILIITTKENQSEFKRLLKDGSDFGINIEYKIQEKPNGLAEAFILGEEFIGDNPCAMILGDNIYYGSGLEKELKKAIENASKGYASIFGYKVKDPERFGIMELDSFNNVLSVEEKPLKPKSDYAITGLYFYPKGVAEKAKQIKPSARGELEITTLNDMYLQDKKLKAEVLGEGFVWFDTGTFDSQIDAANMIRTIEKNKDKVICCPEQIAFYKNWITKEKLQKRADLLKKNTYGEYLFKVLNETK
jgi:glucose-1-phosphate thymidylyltransferase